MDPELKQKLDAQEKKIDEMLEAIRGMKRRSRWTFIINVLVIALPILGLAILLPYLYTSLSGLYSFKGF